MLEIRAVLGGLENVFVGVVCRCDRMCFFVYRCFVYFFRMILDLGYVISAKNIMIVYLSKMFSSGVCFFFSLVL